MNMTLATFAHPGCSRGAHGVTRLNTMGSRQVLAMAWPTSEFGFKAAGLFTLLRLIPHAGHSRAPLRNAGSMVLGVVLIAGVFAMIHAGMVVVV